MKFTFRLERVLEHRWREERAQRQELARRLARQAEAARALEFLRADDAALHKFQRECQQDRLDVFTLVSLESYRVVLEKQIEAGEAELARAAESVREQRRAVREAARRRRVLERLREKAWEEFCGEQKRAEQKFNDELGLYGYMQRQGVAEENLFL